MCLYLFSSGNAVAGSHLTDLSKVVFAQEQLVAGEIFIFTEITSVNCEVVD